MIDRTMRGLSSAAAVFLLTACASAPPDGAFGPAFVPDVDPPRNAQPFAASGEVRVLAEKGASFETTVAVSPQNASQAVVGVISTAAPRGVDVYTTHDGGLTWTSGSRLPNQATNGRTYATSQGDPVVAADRLGMFHMTALMSSGVPPRFTAVTAMRSIDGGLTWSAPIVVAELQVVANDREFDDKQWLAVDDTGGAYDGHVYLFWQRIRFSGASLQSRMTFARSPDRGLTWSEPAMLTEPAPSGQSMIAVGPEGEVHVAYARNDGHFIRTSTDGGVTFSDPVRVPVLPWIGGVIPNTGNAQFKAFPTLLCDRSSGPHRGNLYVVISTSTTSTRQTTVGGAAITRSTDGGRTWSAPRMISTPTTGDAIFPSGAVDQTNGDLVITWLDRRDDPANTLARLYATRSRDGGTTFDEPRGFSPPFSIDADWIGDYYGVSGHAGKWIATFSPASGQMSSVVLRFDEEQPAGPKRRAVRK
ncbi:MAG TPA: sialidase family protein [Thermoanaerobaculia bacterium]|nr:sialidase family protein [Thermoanaerobaculia bacterium]